MRIHTWLPIRRRKRTEMPMIIRVGPPTSDHQPAGTSQGGSPMPVADQSSGGDGPGGPGTSAQSFAVVSEAQAATERSEPAPTSAQEYDPLRELESRVSAGYGWWEKAYRTSAEAALSFACLAIITAALVLAALPGPSRFESSEFITLISSATVIALAAILGRTSTAKTAVEAQKHSEDALLLGVELRRRQTQGESPARSAEE